MSKKWLIVLILLVVSAVAAVDSDNEGLDDANETAGWTVELFNCSNDRVRGHTSSDPYNPNTDSDCADDYSERLWDLNATNQDTDGDGLIDWDPLYPCIYQFPDACPKHCNNFCVPELAAYWKEVACNGNPSFMYQMINDYLWKINHLSYVFNSEDMQKANLLFGLYSEWKYNDSDIDFSDDWVNLSYDDSSWSSGDAYLGYNETLISTELSHGDDPSNKTITYYFRKHFNVTNVSEIDNLEFNIDYDDGFVAYLNSYEIVRSPGASTNHSKYVPYHESTIGDYPSSWLVYEMNSTELGYLVGGENVIAVEMHQCAPDSADIALGAYLVNYENISSRGLLNNVSDMCNILNTSGTDEDDLKRELLALWLNVVSADICYVKNIFRNVYPLVCQNVTTDAIDELIGDAENALINNLSLEYENITQELILINNGSCLDCVTCKSPTSLEINLNDDYESVDLEWQPGRAEYFNIYYSSDPALLVNYSLNQGLPAGITKIEGITDTNWTDWNARDVKERWYKISSVLNETECLGDDIKGKFTYYFYGQPARRDKHYRTNWMSIPLDAELKPSQDILNKCVGGKALRLHRLDRLSLHHYYFESYEWDFRYPSYRLYPGVGYSVEVKGDCNATIVGGLLNESVNRILYGGDYHPKNPYFRTNWVGVNFLLGSNFTAASLLDNITNDAGIRVYTLVRNSSSEYSFETHERGVSPDFNLSKGVGYAVEVNQTSYIELR